LTQAKKAIFCHGYGRLNVIDEKHFKVMKDGAIVCNSGHFNSEINIPAVKKMSKSVRIVRPFVEEYVFKSK
jgi:adenosylhomocysteinase